MEKSKENRRESQRLPDLGDASFIERCIDGDRDERERLARACLPTVRKIVALGYGNRMDSDDVTQKILVAVFRDLGRLRNPCAFKPWMHRIAYNVICSHGSRRARLVSLFFTDSEMDSRPSSFDTTPEKATGQSQILEKLSFHLDKLKPKKKTAVILSLFFGYVDSEVAEIVGCSTETAKKRVQKGRRELIRSVERDPQLRGLIEEAAI